MKKQLVAFAILALAAGTISNLIAGPTRVLRWVAVYQPLPERATPPAAPPASTAPSTSTGAVPPATPAARGDEIGTTEAAAEHAKGTVFIDARASDVFEAGRIPGARSLPVWEASADQKVLELMMQIPPPGPRLILYCQGGHCEDSHMLRQKLLGAGYTDVLVDKDGYPGWVDAGHPVEK